MKYSKITLTMIVQEPANQQVHRELLEAVDLIGEDNVVYSHEITVAPTERPEDAALLDCGESDEDSEGSPE